MRKEKCLRSNPLILLMNKRNCKHMVLVKQGNYKHMVLVNEGNCKHMVLVNEGNCKHMVLVNSKKEIKLPFRLYFMFCGDTRFCNVIEHNSLDNSNLFALLITKFN